MNYGNAKLEGVSDMFQYNGWAKAEGDPYNRLAKESRNQEMHGSSAARPSSYYEEKAGEFYAFDQECLRLDRNAALEATLLILWSE